MVKIDVQIEEAIEDTFKDIFGGKPNSIEEAIEDTFKDVLSGQPCELDVITYTTLLAGHVKDAITGKPLEGVKIVIPELGLSTTTDENGYFEFIDLKEGAYTLRIIWKNDRGVSKTDSYQVKIEDGKDTILDISLKYTTTQKLKLLEGERIVGVIADGYIHIYPKINIQRGDNMFTFHLWRTRRMPNTPHGRWWE